MRGRFRLLLLLALVRGGPAWADGPHIAFHETQGRYIVTLFSAPDPLVAGPVELSLLVQNANDGAVADVPTLSGKLSLPGQPATAFAFQPGAGGNQRLPGTTVALPRPGNYALTLEIADLGGPPVRFAGVLPVYPNNGKRNTVLWAVLLPFAVVFLFLANQYGKQKLREARARARLV